MSTAGDPPPEPAPFTGLSHVQLLVSDVEASAAWYRAALGLDEFVEDLSVGYVALRHHPSKVVIVLTTGLRDVGSEPPGHPGPLDHLAFAVADGSTLSAWADHLEAIGIDHPGIVLEDGRPSLALHDPDGTAIELVAPAPRPSPS
jgi:catechol 2,3-dioxygenase-like lactoylglutathione lyase family enzyme